MRVNSVGVRGILRALLTANVLFAGVVSAVYDGGPATTGSGGSPEVRGTCTRSCCLHRRGEMPRPLDDRHSEHDECPCPVCRFVATVWMPTPIVQVVELTEAVVGELPVSAERPPAIVIRRCPARGPPRC